MIFSDYSPSQITVAQGSTFQVNITLTCYLDTELSLPFENLSLRGYNNTSWQSSTPQEKIFNYTFSENPLILPPNGKGSCILTVTFANDAPVGDYLLFVKYGKTDLTYVAGGNLRVTVTNP